MVTTVLSLEGNCKTLQQRQTCPDKWPLQSLWVTWSQRQHLLVVVGSSALCHILESWCGALGEECGAPLLCWNVARTGRLQGTQSRVWRCFSRLF